MTISPTSKKQVGQLRQRMGEVDRELKALTKFRRTKQRDQFVRQLVGEQSYLKKQLSKLLSFPKKETMRQKQQRLSQANKQRSIKMKRTWDYLRAIQRTYYPDESLRELRSLFKKHKAGLETDVSEVAWRNPSP